MNILDVLFGSYPGAGGVGMLNGIPLAMPDADPVPDGDPFETAAERQRRAAKGKRAVGPATMALFGAGAAPLTAGHVVSDLWGKLTAGPDPSDADPTAPSGAEPSEAWGDSAPSRRSAGPAGTFADPLAASPGGFDTLDSVGVPGDPASEAAAAREAAAMRTQRSVRRPFGFGAEPIPGINEVAGLLSPQAGAAGGNGGGNGAGSNLPPSTNDPFSREPQVVAGDVPLPRPRPVTRNTPAGGLPLSMAPPGPTEGQGVGGAMAQGSMPARAAPPAAVEAPGGRGFSLGNLFQPQNAPLLLSLAGGFAGAPSFGTGMRRAFSGAVPASMALHKEMTGQATMADTYRALIAKGVPPAEAIAAVRDPNIMKATAAKYFETKPLQHVMQKGPLGEETPIAFNPNTGKYQDAAGKEIKPDDTGTGGGASGSLLAPGVKFDKTLTGDDYLNQFSPDVKAAVKAYMNGDVQPTGNPRQKAIANYAKTVAQRYGADTGIPVSDSLFAEKRKYRTELGTNSANSAGGQAKAFNQGIEHGHALAKKLLDLNNYDPVGVPVVARGINATREALITKQAGIAKEAGALGQTLAGEVGKLFSGAAGGGVHERELTRNRFNTVSSPHELAGALEGTIETMEGGLRALEQRRDQILGPNSNVTFVSKETHEKIAEIKSIIKQLRGEKGATATPAAPSLKAGESTVINGVTIKRMD